MLDSLAQYLEDRGVGNYDPTGLTGDIFIGSLPAKPDSCLALFSTGGFPPNPKEAEDYPSVQIRVRGTADPRPAYNRAKNIKETMHGLSAVTLPNGPYVVNCTAEQSLPISIGVDGSGRHEYTVNLTFFIISPTGGREQAGV